MTTHTAGLGRRSVALLGALTAALLLTLTLALAQPAGAQTYPVDNPPEDPKSTNVLGTKLTRKPAADPAGLPVTGGDVMGLTIVGLTLIGSGVLVLRLRRREPQTA